MSSPPPLTRSAGTAASEVPSRPSAEETAALARIRAGQADAFEVIVRLHARTLQRLAVRIVRSEAAAEDVVQEALLKAFRALGRFDDAGARHPILPWLRRIATNCALDSLRRGGREQPLEIHDDEGQPHAFDPVSGDPTPDRRAASGEVRRAARRALGGLSPDERVAFVLRHLEGRSIAEIGQTLGKNDNATKQSIFRAVRKLRRALVGFYELDGVAGGAA
jgi:RNA polymerase sigma-70 factor (ECF subfamily)